MNKKNVVDDLFKNLKYTKDQKELLEAIAGAKREWEEATRYFELVDNPKLVDYAIYKEEAAKARYMYLLNEAKNHKIKVNPYFKIDNSDVG